MKKLICILLGAMCLFTACAAPAAESEETQQTGGNLGIANPMQSCTVQQFTEDTNIYIAFGEEYGNVTVHKYNFEIPLYQFDFVYADNSCTLRIQQAEEMTDISGMNYRWNEAVVQDGCGCTVYTNGEGQGIALWYAEGYAYSISMNENATADTLCAIQQAVAAAM